MSYEIISDPSAMTIRVGNVLFDRPHLNTRSELDFDIKATICEDPPPSSDVKALHKFYCTQLGPKFNRRFQAANYWLWVGNRLSPATGNMLRMRGSKGWRWYNDHLVAMANAVLPYVKEAEEDGLFHLIPAIVVFGASPASIRRKLGGATWKRIARNSKTRNARLMQAAWIAPDDDKYPDRFVRLLDFPSGVLNGVEGFDYEDELVAARITPRRTPIVFQQTMHIVRDTRRMLGAAFNPTWSLARMSREHDRAALESRRKRYSAEPFTQPWGYEAGGYRADLLVSPLEIATEGATQHHCVGSYANEARLHQYAVVRIDGKERATAGYWWEKSGWRLEQVYGACNAPVSDACRAFASATGAALPKENTERRAA